ncbi:DUF1657 domain-containing protein [Fodinisporobacter ferrooxydans]|uniref:DUF1657 domain-containing protein n=1 Tax=Fodinisporobacter ferrooxydans TaxID=2901836 RepID=UPI003242B68E
MTVGIKMHQTLAQCESVVSSFKTFALDTENQNAKQMYSQLAQTMEQQIVNPLRNRVNQLEQEEPTYKVYQQNMQQSPGTQGAANSMMGSPSSAQQKGQKK